MSKGNSKKCKVVILSTEKASNIWLTYENKLSIHPSYTTLAGGQHLYITSNEEIKEGDWYIWLNNKAICQADAMIMTINNHMKNGHIEKIIATTDTLVFKDDYRNQSTPDFLPKPTEGFIKKFVEKYNKGEIITDILVEYEYEDHAIWSKNQYDTYDCHNCNRENFEKEDGCNCLYTFYLKISPQNEITIHPIKQNWTREEVVKLCRDAFIAGQEYEYLADISASDNPNPKPNFNKWIEENL